VIEWEDSMMPSPGIWEPFDRPNRVRLKTKKYIDEMWKDTTKECEIWVSCRDREEDVGFDVRIYTGDRSEVPRLAEQLLDLALIGDTKVYDLNLELHKDEASAEEDYKKDFSTTERTYTEQQGRLAERSKTDERVRQALAKGARNVTVFADVSLFCQLETDRAKKVIVETTANDFKRTKEFLDKLVDRTRNEGLTTRVIGYDLWRDLERLEPYEVRVEGEDIYVWMGYPAR